ncbi:transglutaminase-like domain-containing protein [Tateyamaria pelophila]|uniref:transglutaminase-like domain-containing protein n=1 Tax=Tateyamaria pelophila TaxID=328415 RepID=UPI001CBC395E|nr:transglutaminase family protein [Tateyamaria pelophila]
MLLNVTASLIYSATQSCDALLQVEATSDAGQRCEASRLLLLSGSDLGQVEGEDAIGTRRWVSVTTQLDCRYETQVEITRPDVDLSQLQETPRYQLRGAVIPYLMPSRNCQSDLFLDFTASQFSDLRGGALVQAMSDWIKTNFNYDIFASNAGTTATESFSSLRGVCRDYAHVLIALVRAVGIPARFVSAYAPDVKPQDFHAVVEVFLEGDWHLVDPTGMAQPADIVRICVGRDAADASFLTSYGFLTLQEQSVQVERLAV